MVELCMLVDPFDPESDSAWNGKKKSNTKKCLSITRTNIAVKRPNRFSGTRRPSRQKAHHPLTASLKAQSPEIIEVRFFCGHGFLVILLEEIYGHGSHFKAASHYTSHWGPFADEWYFIGLVFPHGNK